MPDSLFTPITPVGRNLLIGGDFTTNPWQRGTPVVAPVDTQYTADRWQWRTNGGQVFTVSKAANAPTAAQSAGISTSNCLQALCTVANAFPLAGDFAIFRQWIEGINFSAALQQPLILSFWHAHSLVNDYAVAISNGAQTFTFIGAYKQLVANAWEQAVIQISAPPAAIPFLVGVNQKGLGLDFPLLAGANFRGGTNNAWTAGAWLSSATGTGTIGGGVNDAFRIALAQLEIGSIANLFDRLHEQQVLALCQRYFWKTFNQGVTPVQNVGSGVGAITYRTAVAGAVAHGARVPFPVPMMTVPTVVTFNPNIANANWRNFTLAADSGVPAVTANGDSSIFIDNPQVAGDAAGNLQILHVTAMAELIV